MVMVSHVFVTDTYFILVKSGIFVSKWYAIQEQWLLCVMGHLLLFIWGLYSYKFPVFLC